MDYQTAEIMFNAVAKQVVDYMRSSELGEKLTENLQKRLTFLNSVSLSQDPNKKSIDAEIYFFMDESKKEKVHVSVYCQRTKEGITAEGTTKVKGILYTNSTRIYD